ncbi:MAG: hypothetical protein ABIV51_08500, partial [Saprospiraceae bacterium]
MTLRAEFITNRQFVAILVTTVTIAYSSKDQNNLHAVAQEPVSYNFYQRILQTNNWKVLLRKLLRTFLLTLFLLSWNKGFAQKQDNIWYFGWGFKPKTDSINIADSAWGGTNFDFNFDPPKVYYDPVRNLSIEASNASICDENGDMIF